MINLLKVFKNFDDAMEWLANSGELELQQYSSDIKTALLSDGIYYNRYEIIILDPNGLLD